MNSSAAQNTESPAATSPAERHPPRVIGFADLFLFYVVTGISLRWIATAATAGPSAIVIWAGGWLCFFLPLMLSVTELSSRFPQEGGLYVWTKRNFGDFAGFLAAWSYWTSNLSYFPAVLYFAASNALYIRANEWGHLSGSAAYHVSFSLVALAAITAINLVGMKAARWVHNVGALGMWLPVAILVVMGLIGWHRFGSATQFRATSLVPDIHLKGMIFWATILYALTGSEAASFMGDEVKDARRSIPRALLLGGIVITIAYVLGTICVLLAVPSSQINDLQGLMQAATHTASRLGWVAILPICAALICISNLGALSAYLASTARLPFVAGIDRVLPQSFGKLDSRSGTPYVALLAQSGIAVVFVVLGQAGTSVRGAYDVLVSMGILTYFIPFLFIFAAMIRSQSRAPEPGVFHVPGGKPVAIVAACIGFATTAIGIVLSLVPPPEEPNKALAVLKIIGLSAVLLAVGTTLYWMETRKRRARLNVREATQS
jgi:amino acid transporter